MGLKVICNIFKLCLPSVVRSHYISLHACTQLHRHIFTCLAYTCKCTWGWGGLIGCVLHWNTSGMLQLIQCSSKDTVTAPYVATSGICVTNAWSETASESMYVVFMCIPIEQCLSCVNVYIVFADVFVSSSNHYFRITEPPDSITFLMNKLWKWQFSSCCIDVLLRPIFLCMSPNHYIFTSSPSAVLLPLYFVCTQLKTRSAPVVIWEVKCEYIHVTTAVLQHAESLMHL